MSAIAYEDYIQSSDFFSTIMGDSGFVNCDLGDIEFLKTAQLGQVFGGSGATIGAPEISLRAYWEDLRPVNIVAILNLEVDEETPVVITYQYIDASYNSQILPGVSAMYDFPSSDFVRHHFAIPSAPIMARGVFVNILAFSLANPRMTVGRVWAGPLWDTPYGIERKWEHTIEDLGELQLSRGGQGYERREQRIRVHDGNFVQMGFDDAFGVNGSSAIDLQSIAMKLGTTSPAILLPRIRNPNNTLNDQAIHRLGCYGRFYQPIKIRNTAGDYFSANLNFKELL